MKYDIANDPLWNCYEGVLEDWYGQGGETHVNTRMFEMLDAIEDEFDLKTDNDIDRMAEVTKGFIDKLGKDFCLDVREISETGAADVIDEVMDKN